MIEIKFKKIHDDAKLPAQNHGNREINDYEIQFLEAENKRLQAENPQAFESGYRVGFPLEANPKDAERPFVVGTGDTGYDIFGVEDKVIPARGSAVVETGIEVAYISPGFWFMIAPRSGMGFKGGIQPHLGTIDNPYRGHLSVKLYNFSDTDYTVQKGNRIAQLIVYPIISPVISWSEEKHETNRGEKNLGSSGK